MESIKVPFLFETFTVAAAHRRFGLLQRIADTVLYTVPTEASASLEARFMAVLATEPPSGDTAAIAALGTAWLATISEGSFHAACAEFKAWLDALPRFTVYVPVIFDDAGERILGSWCRATYGDTCLLNLEVDPQVIGGCAYIKDGQYKDCSFSAKFRAEPSVAEEVLRTYVSA